jgi:prepilin-type N-terminal cleavage/methylation domain-containing protein
MRKRKRTIEFAPAATIPTDTDSLKVCARGAGWRAESGTPNRAFTLVELLLVMTLLVIVISIAGPTLANFFRGRTLDSEARRLLALTHAGQSRAVSEGVPMDLWLDVPQHNYGLKQDPSWGDQDPKAMDFEFDKDLQVQIINPNQPRVSASRNGLSHNTQARTDPRNLPEIRFLPDGSIDETSPQALHLSDRSGTSLWLAQATNRLSYEIRQTYE